MSSENDSPLLNSLCAQFPACFSVADPHPLKVGIFKDLRNVFAKAVVSRQELGRAIWIYVNSAAYLAALTAGAVRIDLEGKPAGIVTAQEAEHALGGPQPWPNRSQQHKAYRKQARQRKARQRAAQQRLSPAVPKPQPQSSPVSASKSQSQRSSLADLKGAAMRRRREGAK